MSATFTTRPQLEGSYGMVSSTHWLATASAMAVLERGGNAFDAAVAGGFVLQVVEPDLNGIGGEVPILVRKGFAGDVLVIRGQGPAPRAATIERFAALGLDAIPRTGFLPACVPAAFGAWMTLLRDFGTIPLRDALSPAIEYARRGFPILPRVCATIARVRDLFTSEWLDSVPQWLVGGDVPEPNSVFRNAQLAALYERLLGDAERAVNRETQIEAALASFYDGFVADTVSKHVARAAVMDTSGARHHGLLTAGDFHGWRPAVEDPVSVEYRGLRVFKTQPWGQGPVFLQQLQLLRALDVAQLGHLSANFIHEVIEAAKLAFADREAWYGDPAFARVPIDELLSDEYASIRRRLIGERASYDLRPGCPAGTASRIPHFGDAHAVVQPDDAGMVTVGADGATRDDTCHIDVIDRYGNVVAATPSGGMLQSSPSLPSLGFSLGARAQMFNLEEGHPNCLHPGKLPRTTLSPTIAMNDRRTLAFGTRGGDKQDQWTLNFFLGVVDFGLNLQEAIDAPNFHTTHCPDSFYPHKAFPGQVHIEDRVASQVLSDLTSRGHRIELEPAWSLGHVCAVGWDGSRDVLVAAANARGMNAYAAGR